MDIPPDSPVTPAEAAGAPEQEEADDVEAFLAAERTANDYHL